MNFEKDNINFYPGMPETTFSYDEDDLNSLNDPFLKEKIEEINKLIQEKKELEKKPIQTTKIEDEIGDIENLIANKIVELKKIKIRKAS